MLNPLTIKLELPNDSSVKKGTKFEKVIFDHFSQMIEQRRFMFQPENTRIFWQKGYYSGDRKSDIIFDISIEVYLPGEETYSLLILVECKDYKDSVPVNDVEEFYAKTQQVSGGTVKGIIVSTNTFQKGAFQVAKAKNFGLMRYASHSDYKWLLTRSPSTLISIGFAATDWNDARWGLTEENYLSRYYDFHCFSDGCFSNSILEFFHNLVLNDPEEVFNRRIQKIIISKDAYGCAVPFLRKDEIENKSKLLLKRISYKEGPVQLKSVYQKELEANAINVNFAKKHNSNHLGTISFDPAIITIFKDPQSATRQKFTLAHELGHFYLGHGTYMRAEYCEDNDYSPLAPSSGGIKEIARMEWQANYFASCLIMPKEPLVELFARLFLKYDLRDHGHGLLFVDDQPVNISTFMSVTDVLKNVFQVSRSVVKIRLEMLGWLNDRRGQMSSTRSLSTEQNEWF